MATYLTVTGTRELSPSMRRIHFRSDDLSAFADSLDTDRYVKLVFPRGGRPLPHPLDMRALRGSVPPLCIGPPSPGEVNGHSPSPALGPTISRDLWGAHEAFRHLPV